MVRPFLRWIVSARALDEASARQKARKVTRHRIQAHSSNAETRNLRDEGTIEAPSHADRGMLVSALSMVFQSRGCCRETGGEPLFATGRNRARRFASLQGAGSVAEPTVDADQPRRWHDLFHSGCNGPHHRSLLRGRWRDSPHTSE